MRYLSIIFFISFCLSGLLAQEKHFVFIQSDNNQPFYVSLNRKLYSSSASGYVILPKLTDGSYNLSVGFAKNAFPEQSFQFAIDNKDLGFDLKNFGEKGWGLSNLQSLGVTMAQSENTDNISKALQEKNVAKEEAEPVISFDRKKKDTNAQPVIKNAADTMASQAVTKNEEQKNPEVKSNTAAAESNENNAAVGGDVRKVSESKAEDGVHLAYVEGEGKKGDTINVIIPSDKSAANAENNNSPAETDISTGNSASSTKPVASESTAKDSLHFLDLDMDKSKKEVNQGSAAQENTASVTSNSKCKDIATDNEYARLRRKMAMQTTDEKMINEARKMYRNKCFTTRQIKSLSTLFLSDEGRYNFFNASYNSVADVSEYSTLQSEFIDPAFIDRFKAMLK